MNYYITAKSDGRAHKTAAKTLRAAKSLCTRRYNDGWLDDTLVVLRGLATPVAARRNRPHSPWVEL